MSNESSANITIISQITTIPVEQLVPDLSVEYTRNELFVCLRNCVLEIFDGLDDYQQRLMVTDLIKRYQDKNIDITFISELDLLDEYIRVAVLIHDYYSANRDLLDSLKNMFTKHLAYCEFLDIRKALINTEEIDQIIQQFTWRYGFYPDRVRYTTDFNTCIICVYAGQDNKFGTLPFSQKLHDLM